MLLRHGITLVLAVGKGTTNPLVTSAEKSKKQVCTVPDPTDGGKRFTVWRRTGAYREEDDTSDTQGNDFVVKTGAWGRPPALSDAASGLCNYTVLHVMPELVDTTGEDVTQRVAAALPELRRVVFDELRVWEVGMKARSCWQTG